MREADGQVRAQAVVVRLRSVGGAAINRQCNEIPGAREFKARLDSDGVEAAQPNSPAAYRSAVAGDIARLERFFESPGISKDVFRQWARGVMTA